MNASVSVDVHPGEVLAGKYRVERVLGRGGMGVVVAAHHEQLDTKVAIKFLLPEMLASYEAVERFSREARAAAKITSEHVARVLDVGVLENGAPYMVMELLEGLDLAAWLRKNGPLPIEQAVDFVLQACVAVAEAHALGIIHRDLKPANLFCVRRPDGQLLVKVLDFGISKRGDVSASHPSVTGTSAMMGSPLYMSPEQMRSARRADAQSDIWALGVVLYQLLAGRVPFWGESLGDVMAKVITDPPPPLREARPDVPVELDAVIVRCLEKDKTRRFRNVAELAHALAPFAPKRSKGSIERILGTIQSAGLSASALALPPSPPAPAPTPPLNTLPSAGSSSAPVSRTTPTTTPGAPPRDRRHLPLAVALGAALALAALVGALGVGARILRSRTIAASSAIADAGLTAAAIPPPPRATELDAPAPPAAPNASVALSAPALSASSPPLRRVVSHGVSRADATRTVAPPPPTPPPSTSAPPRPSTSAPSHAPPGSSNPLDLPMK